MYLEINKTGLRMKVMEINLNITLKKYINLWIKNYYNQTFVAYLDNLNTPIRPFYGCKL